MKKFIGIIGLVFLLSQRLMAVSSVNGTPVNLLGINSNSGGYTGSSTFTVVDQANVPANLSLQGITLTGAGLVGSVAGNVTGNLTGNVTSSTTVQGSLTLAIASGLTIAQLLTLTPSTTGQIIFCTNCTSTLLVISTGVVPGSFAGVVNSTGSALSVPK